MSPAALQALSFCCVALLYCCSLFNTSGSILFTSLLPVIFLQAVFIITNFCLRFQWLVF